MKKKVIVLLCTKNVTNRIWRILEILLPTNVSKVLKGMLFEKIFLMMVHQKAPEKHAGCTANQH